jgi:hypothetical protein
VSIAASPSDGLPWPVVVILALATLAALYGVSVLAARFRRPPPPAAPEAVLARPVTVHARDTRPYDDDGAVTFGHDDDEYTEDEQ